MNLWGRAVNEMLKNGGPFPPERSEVEVVVKYFEGNSPNCIFCMDTEEVENPLTGEMHFCPICGEN